MLLALVRRYLRPYRWPVMAVMVLQTLSSLASLYLPTINAAIIDDGVAAGETALIFRLGLVMLAVTALQGIVAIGAVYFGSRTGMGFGRDLRAAMFSHVISLSETETARFGAPTLLTRTTNDVRQVQVLVQMTATVLLAVGNFLIVSRMLPIFRSMQQRIDAINRILREQLAGVRVVRAFGREPFEEQRFDAANHAVADATLVAGRWQALMLPVTTLTINISSVALIWFGGRLIDAGRMQVGSLIAFLSYFMQILMAVLMATLVLAILPRASVCAERITEVLNTRAAISSPSSPRRPTGAVRGAVVLDEVEFSYPGAEQPVLQGISFTVRPGSTTAIVGGTGSGKSTLVSLICRLYDADVGTVCIDDIDVRDYDTEYLWSALGLVPQRGYLFAGTVADNLRYGRADATDDEMWGALRVAAAEDFVAAHPDGLGMPVAQAGINLSGGQRQRLAIARAVIREPAIYVFDDAFSALDTITEARIREALRTVSANATVIVVAQRISTVAQADQIIVVDGGRMVGSGRHDELLDHCPQYREFVDSQAVGAGVGGLR